MQLVVHAPFGGRVNRAFGLALRKRFCATFDFELQAAASDDAVVLSLGPQHSFPVGGRRQAAALDHRAHRAVAGGAGVADVRLPVAVEPQPLPRRAPVPGRPPHAAAHPADGGGRPDGGRLPRPGGLPGERSGRPDRHPRPRAGPPDPRRLPPRGDGRRRALRPPSGDGGRLHPGPRHRDHRALGAGPGDPERQALHLPGRRPARGAPHPGGPDAPGRAPRAGRPRPARRRRHRPGPAGRRPPRCARREELHDLLLSVVALRPELGWADRFAELYDAGRAVVRHHRGRRSGLWLATERAGWVEAASGRAPVSRPVRCRPTSRRCPTRIPTSWWPRCSGAIST